LAGMKGHDYIWNKSWIEFQAPSAQGVHCIRSQEGKALFVSKGNLREGLLSHWEKQDRVDTAIWSGNPHSFAFELTGNPAEREAELVRELLPSCNPNRALPFR
jgi:hypothetical protein